MFVDAKRKLDINIIVDSTFTGCFFLVVMETYDF